MALLQLQPQDVPQPGRRTLLRRHGCEVVLFNVDGKLFAIDDQCPHAGAALCTGKLDGAVIQCPAHGLRFDLRSGAMPGNTGLRVAVYPVHERDGTYEVELPDEAL